MDKLSKYLDENSNFNQNYIDSACNAARRYRKWGAIPLGWSCAATFMLAAGFLINGKCHASFTTLEIAACELGAGLTLANVTDYKIAKIRADLVLGLERGHLPQFPNKHL